MDFKKLIADLAARYRKLTEPISSSSLEPPGHVVDVDAAHEAGRKAGYEVGYKKGYDDQVGLEAKTLPEPSGPKSRSGTALAGFAQVQVSSRVVSVSQPPRTPLFMTVGESIAAEISTVTDTRVLSRPHPTTLFTRSNGIVTRRAT